MRRNRRFGKSSLSEFRRGILAQVAANRQRAEADDLAGMGLGEMTAVGPDYIPIFALVRIFVDVIDEQSLREIGVVQGVVASSRILGRAAYMI